MELVSCHGNAAEEFSSVCYNVNGYVLRTKFLSMATVIIIIIIQGLDLI
jgi:hypothetical protein